MVQLLQAGLAPAIIVLALAFGFYLKTKKRFLLVIAISLSWIGTAIILTVLTLLT
jgi:hypothetical protein